MIQVEEEKLSKERKEQAFLNYGEEDQLIISGYKKNKIGTAFIWVLYVVTLGLLRLVFHWFPRWKLIFTHAKCNISEAQKLLITENFQGKFKSYFVEDILHLSLENGIQETTDLEEKQKLSNLHSDTLIAYLKDGTQLQRKTFKLLNCKNVCYIWNDSTLSFSKLSGLEKALNLEEFHSLKGQSDEQQLLQRIVYGKNEIRVPRDGIFKLFVLETLNPFYIFQLFTIVVWLAEYYYYYTIAIAIMSAFGITSSIMQTRQNQKNLRGTVHAADKIKVLRPRGPSNPECKEELIETIDLVPGDVIVLPCNGCLMHCDAVLLSGSCIANESMLTGESVPVTKTALPELSGKCYDAKDDAKHTLFSGTKVIQTRGEVRAIVIRTGYLTTKGQLIRSVLFPKPADFKFDQDSYKFILILAVICTFGLIYTIISKSSRDNTVWDITIKALDLITIGIPPALPAAMTVGKLYALNRLKKAQIFCINSRVINVSGSINCVCFDKTGTLTEDGLDLWGVVNPKHAIVKEISSLEEENQLLRGMLTCHSLTAIDGELMGDPLDLKMFESTGWHLEEPQMVDSYAFMIVQGSKRVGIVRQFQFSSSLQRMSVIAKFYDSNELVVHCKGSPEVIASLCKPSTIPEGFQDNLKTYTEQGYRVIALATAPLFMQNVQKIGREEIERDLSYSGLLVLENRLKPETMRIVQELQEASIKTVMITGDNLQTAVSVATECNIVRSGEKVVEVVARATAQTTIRIATNGTDARALSINGANWDTIRSNFPVLIPRIVAHASVYARMSGEQKQQVIYELQKLGYFVAMCGDGANDCGALKAAHVGISLSEAESSIASPFVSRNQNVSCVSSVIKEGRAALVTSFGVFKFMICYSLAEFTSVIILYGIDCNLTSFQFLFIDICLVLNFAFFFGKTESQAKLAKHAKPLTTLLAFVPIASIVANIFFVILFQIIAYRLIQTFDWFVPFVHNVDEPMFYTSYENYAVFTVSMFQYIAMAIVFSKGKPYRKPIYTNFLFAASLVIMCAVCIYITVNPAFWLTDLLELKLPLYFEGAYLILFLALFNFVFALLAETILVDIILDNKVLPYFLRHISRKTNKVHDVENQLNINLFNCQSTRL